MDKAMVERCETLIRLHQDLIRLVVSQHTAKVQIKTISKELEIYDQKFIAPYNGSWYLITINEDGIMTDCEAIQTINQLAN